MAEQTANRMTSTLASDKEVTIIRDFDAPRSLVFEVMTKCEHLVHWWGPRGYVLEICENDVRPGGAYRFSQRAPDGVLHPFKGTWLHVVAPERAVFTQIYDVPPINDHVMEVDNTLTEDGGKTHLVQCLSFDSLESRDAMIASGMEKGEAESFERLDELLIELQRPR